jgi:hypothetical protein
MITAPVVIKKKIVKNKSEAKYESRRTYKIRKDNET